MRPTLRPHRPPLQILSGFLALVLPLALAALACNFLPTGDKVLRETDIALGIQQTFVAQTGTAIVLSSNSTPAPGTAASSTPQAQVNPTTAVPTDTVPPTLPPSDTPIPTPTATPIVEIAASIPLLEWDRVNMVESKRCDGQEDTPCWFGNEEQLGITLKKNILIDPAWSHPYLVFKHRYNFQGVASIYVNAGNGWEVLRTYPKGVVNWNEVALDLSKYKGKEITLHFTITHTARVSGGHSPPKNSWAIQNILVVPDYTD